MFRSTAPSFNQLPVEILHGIFRYLDVPDILRIRRVSRYLNEVSHSRDVWSDAYRRAKFICPPGPFLWQSAHDLENALVPGFRVDQNLSQGGGTSQKEKLMLKLREIRYTGVALRVSLVFGRYLLIALKEEVRCYDLSLDAFDSNSGASIVYRPTGGTINSFHCVSAFDIEGRPFACAVLNEMIQHITQISVYSLNVGEGSDVTLDLLYHFDHTVFHVDGVVLGPRVIVIRGRGPHLDRDWNWRHALDVHTCTEFIIPFSNREVWKDTIEPPEWRTIVEFTSPTIISTSTHLLLAMSFYTQADGWTTFLQAFALPPSHTHRFPTSTILIPSHQGSIPGINMHDTILLHDAMLDPTTQDVVVAVRVHAYEPSRPPSPLSKYGVLRLSSAPTSHGHDSEVRGTISFQLLGSLGQYPQTPFRRPSFNGAGRAFFMVQPGSWVVSALEYDLRPSGSDDGEHEARIVEYPSVLRFPTLRTLLDYDPYSGRMCLQYDMARYSAIEIFDLTR